MTDKRCHICKRILGDITDPLSMDCGGDCWGCIKEIESEMNPEQTENLDDLFWPIKTMESPNGSTISYREVEGHNPFKGEHVPKGEWPGYDEDKLGEEFDELSHLQEQYDIKCDELLKAMLENRRLSLIIINNGLENLLEKKDEISKDQKSSKRKRRH